MLARRFNSPSISEIRVTNLCVQKTAMIETFLRYSIIALLIFNLTPSAGHTCTTFHLEKIGQKIFGKNYDWHLGGGLLIVNKRGVYKKAMPGILKDPGQYAEWTSKYGSLTFNQYGRELPMGGINEAGLVVELMLLFRTKYPEPDARRAIKDLQWIQYQLDNFSTVEEVIESDRHIRILSREQPGLHFLVADRTGNCAAIEFLDGELSFHSRDTMTVKALTNHTYAESTAFLRMHKGFGGQLPIEKGERSLKRFIYTAKMLREYNLQIHGPAVDFAFDILKNVSQPSTRWSIVYDQENLRVYFRTYSNEKIRYADLDALDFSCAAPVKVLDIGADVAGNVGDRFDDYSRQINLELIEYAINGTPFMDRIPDRFVDQRVVYPESTLCAP